MSSVTFTPDVRPNCMAPLSFAVIVGCWLMAATNVSFWKHAFLYFGGLTGPFLAFVAAMCLILLAIFMFLAIPELQKRLAYAAILLAAVAAYFMDNFGFVVDRNMLATMSEMKRDYAGYVVLAGFGMHMILFGLAPIAFLSEINLDARPRVGCMARHAVAAASALAVAATLMLANFTNIAAVLHEHPDLMKRFNPGGVLFATIGFAVEEDSKASAVAVRPSTR